MVRGLGWSRRRFLAASGVAAGVSVARVPAFAVDGVAGQEGNRIPPPVVITGGVRPLFESNTARPLRYTPDGGDFVVRNGSEFFNRPIYGAVSDFRVDAGDRPEFSLYLPGHGGNLKLGFIPARDAKGAKWAADADQVIARFRPGRMIYEVRDRQLERGRLEIELLTPAEGNGLLVRVVPQDLPPGTRLAWAFAGASGRKGRRNGDIGCEVEPVSRFFQVRAEECEGNEFRLAKNGPVTDCRLHAEACEMVFGSPVGAELRVAEFAAWSAVPAAGGASVPGAKQPVMLGSVVAGSQPIFLTLKQVRSGEDSAALEGETAFEPRSLQVAETAATIGLKTPDAYLNAMGPALGMVADALWDEKQQCVMHGCVAWRAALAGWRGPYVLDATGAHERAKLHFRHWLKRQNVTPIMTGDPAEGPADPNMRLARKENLLHSNGDISNNHYDMNMVFFDVLLRHLRWTGDAEFAREIWPALKRHLAWEQRLFRRMFQVDGRELPLYEAYAAIWASDNLQYSGGGAAHSSAYNVFSFRRAAELARLLGEDGTAYSREAELIELGMQKLLWVAGQGAFAEAKDLMGPQTVYTNPAAWTVYHTIDSEVPGPRQAWQMVAERLAVLRRIPVHGEGVPAGDWYLLACSDWLPYMWSLTLVLMAECMHMALAMWQAGMAEEAYGLFKGAMLDSMYMGLCPGDFHMTSALDGHRQEAQRDFGDPTGCTSRALVEGLFGVRPDLIGGRIALRPGFPAEWQDASMRHKDFDFAWRRDGLTEVYEFTSRFPRAVPVELRVPARTTTLPRVAGAEVSFDAEAVGRPMVVIKLAAAKNFRVEMQWSGAVPMARPAVQRLAAGAALVVPGGVQIDDPQGCLRDGRAVATGFHTVFATVREGACAWVMPVSFEVAGAAFAAVPKLEAGREEHVELAAVLTHGVTEMFARSYAEPRSPLCALSVPDTLLGGWANIAEPFALDDSGLRGAGGVLKTPLGVSFRTPGGVAPNCALLSYFKPDRQALTVPLSGRAAGVYLLVTGTTLPQCSRMQHALATVRYADGSAATLELRNPETWWPVEQDYLLDDYLFVDRAPLPPRVSLKTGETRLLEYASFKGKGRTVQGGAATVVYLRLDPAKTLASLGFEVSLYNVVAALLGVTLVRPA
jgi:hypothetical protein